MATKKAKDKSMAAPRIEPPTENSEALIFPVIHEEITIDKRIVESGKVKISKRISQHEELVDIPLLREKVTVQSVPVNKVVDTAPQTRQEGDTLIIPIVQEQVVYQKRLVLVEELHIKKQIVEEHKPQQVVLQKEEVEVKRTSSRDSKNSRG